MVVMGNDIFKVFLPDLFLFSGRESMEVLDKKFADPDNLSLLNLIRFGDLSEGIKEKLFQEGDNLIWGILAVSFLEEKTEK